MKSVMTAILLCAPFWCWSCAIESNHTFSKAFELSNNDPDIDFDMTMETNGIFRILNETWIELPPLLHLQYAGGPFHPRLSIVDRTGRFTELKIDSMVVRYKDRPPIELAKQRTYPLEVSDNGTRAASVHLPARVHRHEKVEIWCRGKLIRSDGSYQEFESGHRFHPEKCEFITDWFSWCASV